MKGVSHQNQNRKIHFARGGIEGEEKRGREEVGEVRMGVVETLTAANVLHLQWI